MLSSSLFRRLKIGRYNDYRSVAQTSNNSEGSVTVRTEPETSGQNHGMVSIASVWMLRFDTILFSTFSVTIETSRDPSTGSLP